MFFLITAAYPHGSLPSCLSHCGLDRGSPQRDGRRDQQELLGNKRRCPEEWIVSGYQVPPRSNAESLVLSYQSRLRDVAKRDIHYHSLLTYRNGWRKFLGFCVIFDVPPLSPGVPWPDIFECFLLYAVQDALRKVAPFTANEYVSHVLKHLEHEGFWNIRASARSPRYNAVQHALIRDHAERFLSPYLSSSGLSIT